MKCTIKQLAEELNLSRNTVAKALKNSNQVSEKTKQLVLKKAKELNYKNIDEKLLLSVSPESTSQTVTNNGSILFLTRTYAPDSEFWTAVLTGIESILSRARYHLIIGIMSESDLKRLEAIAYIHNFTSDYVDGTIEDNYENMSMSEEMVLKKYITITFYLIEIKNLLIIKK